MKEVTLEETLEYDTGEPYCNEDEQREQIEYWLRVYEMIRPHNGL
jgi:hypothetical protein